MNPGGVKENANPIVHQVQEGKTRRRKNDVFQRLNFVQEEASDLPLAQTHDWQVERSAEDRAIFLALTDVAAASPSSVSLLRKAGLDIPTSSGDVLREPRFVPAVRFAKAALEPANNNKRDAIDAEEIFNIIRNIQDPEHPLTLEQLNVVNRDHIAVQDNFVSEGDPTRNTQLSTVDVRFT